MPARFDTGETRITSDEVRGAGRMQTNARVATEKRKFAAFYNTPTPIPPVSRFRPIQALLPPPPPVGRELLTLWHRALLRVLVQKLLERPALRDFS